MKYALKSFLLTGVAVALSACTLTCPNQGSYSDGPYASERTAGSGVKSSYTGCHADGNRDSYAYEDESPVSNQ